MFFLYGPQAPTAFSNGPSCTQFQAEFVEEFIKRAEAEGLTRVEAKQEVEEDWTKRMQEKWDITLFPLAKSWYQGMSAHQEDVMLRLCTDSTDPRRREHPGKEGRTAQLGWWYARVCLQLARVFGQQLPGMAYGEGLLGHGIRREAHGRIEVDMYECFSTALVSSLQSWCMICRQRPWCSTSDRDYRCGGDSSN